MKFDAPTIIKPLQLGIGDVEAWARGRDPRAVDQWNQIGREEYGRAFTAAQTAGAGVIDDLYRGFVDNLANDGEFKDFAAQVTPIMKAKGWLGGDDREIANRLALIYGTNLNRARQAGMADRYQRGKAGLPYIVGISAHDNRVRHAPKSPHSDHRAWDGICLPVDHWFWQKWGFGNIGFRCRCSSRQLTRSALARRSTGITPEAEVEARDKRLGEVVFASPFAPISAQLDAMVAPVNDPETRTPARPIVSPAEGMRRGSALFDLVLGEEAVASVTLFLQKLFGVDA